MGSSMATAKITITIEEDQLTAIRKLVRDGKARSVSGFAQHAISVSLADVAGWGVMLATALEETLSLIHI